MEPANTPPGSAPSPAPAPAAKPPRSKLYRVMMGALGIVFVVIGATQVYDVFKGYFVLPDCDSKTAKDTLANVFKERKFEPVRYDSIKTVSSSKDEVVCYAVLPLKDGNKLAADYSFYWDDKTAKLKYLLHDAELPACDSQRAKTSLDAVFKERNFSPLRYETVTTVSSTSNEVVCNAVLPLPDGVNLIADYTFYWEGNQPQIKYSMRRKAP